MQTIETLICSQAKIESKIIVHEIIRNLRYGIHHEITRRLPGTVLASLHSVRDPQEIRHVTGTMRLGLSSIVQTFSSDLSICINSGWMEPSSTNLLEAKLREFTDKSDREFFEKFLEATRVACGSELRQLTALCQLESEDSGLVASFEPWVFCYAWQGVCVEQLQPMIKVKSALELTALPIISAVRDSYLIFVQLAKEFLRAKNVVEPIPFVKTLPLEASNSPFFKPL